MCEIKIAIFLALYGIYKFSGFSFTVLIRAITVRTSYQREKIINLYMSRKGYMYDKEKALDEYLHYVNSLYLFSNNGRIRMQWLKDFILIPFRV